MKGLKHFFNPYPVDTRALSLHGIGVREKMRPGIINRPAGTGDYLFMQIHQQCYMGSGEQETTVKRNSLIVWTPRDGHYYGCPDSGWSHSWIHCDGKDISRWLRETQITTGTVLPNVDAGMIDRHLLNIHEEVTRYDPLDTTIVGNLLQNMIRQISRCLQQPPAHAAPEHILAVKQFIDTHHDEPLHLAELANMCHLSVPHFCAEFKRWFDTPAIEYVIQLRMQRAAYLLRDQNLRIGQIAERVGYEDPYHFSKLFRKHFGMSPRQYRQTI